MTTLTHPTLADVTVTVPDSAASDWIDQGWVEDSTSATAEAPKPKRTRTPRATT